MRKQLLVLFTLMIPIFIAGNKVFNNNEDFEDHAANLIRTIIDFSGTKKGWINLLTIGNLPDSFFKKTQGLPMSFVVANNDYNGYYIIEETQQYPAHTMIIDCEDFTDFEKKINTARNIPYWHPHTNTILNYHNFEETNENVAKIFFALWYYSVPNAIILQHDVISDRHMVTYFNPYISEHYRLESSFGCWTKRKLAFPVEFLQKDIVCTHHCHNITIQSKLRAEHLGTCIGFETVHIRHNDSEQFQKLKLFEDKAANLHGFKLRAYVTEVTPFMLVDQNKDGTYTIHARDGWMWNAMAEAMNFSIDLSVNGNAIKNTFNFEVAIQQLFDFAKRKADLILIPIYQFDYVIIELDMTAAYKESGVCFLSHRAGFETNLFDVNFKSNFSILIQFICCFVGTWFVFFVFNIFEKGSISCDQAGKDLVNAVRTILSISLYRPPKKETFKIFLLTSIWCFFIINFATQAAIISFFSTIKKGKDVDTFDDVIEKGYPIEGMASPDVMLPETEEKFQKINSKIEQIKNLFSCVTHMTNDSRRFCLIDCSVGRYLERNRLNEKGEQYLHISREQVHNNYLNMVLPKNSPLRDEFNRHMYKFIQAGLINKWEQYRFANIKFETPVKPLATNDLIGVFKCYTLMVGLSIIIFVIEVVKSSIQLCREKMSA